VYTSEGIKLRAIETQLAEQQKLTWGLLVLGIAVGFVGMHFVVARPLTRELERMKVEMVSMEGRLEQLTAAGEQVWEANSLLSSLKAQHSQLEEARTALQTVRQLRTEVLDETRQIAPAIATMNDVAALNAKIVGQRDSTAKSLSQMTTLDRQLIEQQRSRTRSKNKPPTCPPLATPSRTSSNSASSCGPKRCRWTPPGRDSRG
jgi:hypothetical protein